MKQINTRFCAYRKEQNEEIIALYTQTFSDSEGENEGKVIGALVTDLLNTTPVQELKVFLAQKENKLIGCILFTPLRFENGETAFLLSPVATLTQYQGKGVAQTLIHHGLQTLKDQDINMVFTYGDPNFYSKVGFQQVTEAEFNPPHPLSYPHGWLAQRLDKAVLSAIKGKSSCAKGLDNPNFW